MSRKKIYFINLLPIMLISINLRAPITSAGPIANLLQNYYGLSSAQVGLLTSLPLLAFGIVSFLVAVFQPVRAMFFGLLCIILGEILRCVGGQHSLICRHGNHGFWYRYSKCFIAELCKGKVSQRDSKDYGNL
ncbi:hypothetical protein [Helicobacter bilis]|uniref:hypothetical protein n=1 Tax=Helicobacter bilis TaxID=37372 RepID=UPI0026F02A83|nr:hypothetical protein [Helicobacter bilis]